MPVPISARAKKYLSGSNHYFELDSSDPEWMPRILKSVDEDLIGVYRNSLDDLEHSLVITTQGIHYLSTSDSKFIDYENISEVCSVSHDKVHMLENPEARRLRLKLRSGEEVEFPVVGIREGGGADIASVHSFLRGAAKTKRIEREKAGR